MTAYRYDDASNLGEVEVDRAAYLAAADRDTGAIRAGDILAAATLGRLGIDAGVTIYLEDDAPAVAPRLRELIAASGRSLRDVAREMGVSPSNLSEIARGETDPRASTLAAILAALGKSWADLDPCRTP